MSKMFSSNLERRRPVSDPAVLRSLEPDDCRRAMPGVCPFSLWATVSTPVENLVTRVVGSVDVLGAFGAAASHDGSAEGLVVPEVGHALGSHLHHTDALAKRLVGNDALVQLKTTSLVQ